MMVIQVTGGGLAPFTIGSATSYLESQGYAVAHADGSGTLSWGSGTPFVWTFDAGATDPTLSFGSGTVDFSVTPTVGTVDVVLDTRTLTGGVGIAPIGDLSANRTVTVATTEIGTTTWGSGAAFLWTFDGGAGLQLDTVANGGAVVQDGGAEVVSFRDSTRTRGIDLTLTAAGNQTVAASGGNLNLTLGQGLVSRTLSITDAPQTFSVIQAISAGGGDGELVKERQRMLYAANGNPYYQIWSPSDAAWRTVWWYNLNVYSQGAGLETMNFGRTLWLDPPLISNKAMAFAFEYGGTPGAVPPDSGNAGIGWLGFVSNIDAGAGNGTMFLGVENNRDVALATTTTVGGAELPNQAIRRLIFTGDTAVLRQDAILQYSDLMFGTQAGIDSDIPIIGARTISTAAATNLKIAPGTTGSLVIDKASDGVGLWLYREGNARLSMAVTTAIGNASATISTFAGGGLTISTSADGNLSLSPGGAGQVQITSPLTYLADGGNLVIGHTAQVSPAGGAWGTQILGTTSTDSTLLLERWSATSGGPSIILAKSRHASIGSYTIVEDDDIIGNISWLAADGNGTNHYSVASISAQIDGTPGAADLPGRLVFSTTADGASVGTERLRIDSTGSMTLADGGWFQMGGAAPTATDCDAAGEEGRLWSDTTNGFLYWCDQTGAGVGWQVVYDGSG